jgi:hypothetical protein
MQLKLPALLVTVGVIAAMNGCGDGTGIKPQFDNFDAQDTVFAMTGVSPLLPSGLLVRDAGSKRVDGSLNFDVAFDLDVNDNIILYTQRRIASQLVQGHRVGLQTTTQPFDAVTRGPVSGYKYDSLLTVALHQTVLIDVVDPTCSVLSILGPNIKAKLVVDSIGPARQIYLHVLVDPNCGFTSLVQGTPKD